MLLTFIGLTPECIIFLLNIALGIMQDECLINDAGISLTDKYNRKQSNLEPWCSGYIRRVRVGAIVNFLYVKIDLKLFTLIADF